MAFMDNALAFSADWSTPQAITATAASTNVVDITGAGVGNAPNMIGGFPQVNNAIGNDWGVGDGVAIPYLYLAVTTAGTGSGTIQVEIQAAPDDGSYSPGTYTTIYESVPVVGSTLVAGSSLIVQLPPTLFNFPNEAPPRFYRLNFVVTGTATVSVLAGLMINPPSYKLGGKYPNNFVAV